VSLETLVNTAKAVRQVEETVAAAEKALPGSSSMRATSEILSDSSAQTASSAHGEVASTSPPPSDDSRAAAEMSTSLGLGPSRIKSETVVERRPAAEDRFFADLRLPRPQRPTMAPTQQPPGSSPQEMPSVLDIKARSRSDSERFAEPSGDQGDQSLVLKHDPYAKDEEKGCCASCTIQ